YCPMVRGLPAARSIGPAAPGRDPSPVSWSRAASVGTRISGSVSRAGCLADSSLGEDAKSSSAGIIARLAKRNALEMHSPKFLRWKILRRTGRQRILQVAGTDEIGSAERERALPFPPNKGGVHRVRGPEELENVCFFN